MHANVIALRFLLVMMRRKLFPLSFLAIGAAIAVLLVVNAPPAPDWASKIKKGMTASEVDQILKRGIKEGWQIMPEGYVLRNWDMGSSRVFVKFLDDEVCEAFAFEKDESFVE